MRHLSDIATLIAHRDLELQVVINQQNQRIEALEKYELLTKELTIKLRTAEVKMRKLKRQRDKASSNAKEYRGHALKYQAELVKLKKSILPE